MAVKTSLIRSLSVNDKDVVIQEADKVVIKSLLQHDKKNQSNQIRFVLLEKIGKAVVDQLVR
jgi:3-dehydroquinate synthetase